MILLNFDFTSFDHMNNDTVVFYMLGNAITPPVQWTVLCLLLKRDYFSQILIGWFKQKLEERQRQDIAVLWAFVYEYCL